MFVLLIVACALLSLSANGNCIKVDSENDLNNFFRFRDFVPRYTPNSSSSSSTSSYPLNGGPRDARGFQFHVLNDDLIVHLEFTVPLIEIPVERSMAFARTALRNLVNLNVSSLLYSGLILAIGGVIFVLVKMFTTPFIYTTNDYYGKKKSRLHNEVLNNQTARDNLIDELEATLQLHNFDAAACLQHTVCKYFKTNTADNVSQPWRKIVDGLINLHQVQPFVSGSPLQRAIAASRDKSRSCESLPGSCRWQGAANELTQLLFKYIT